MEDLKNKIIGFAYRHSKNEYLVETYAIVYDGDEFLYMPLKKYEKVYDYNSVIEELEKIGFKNINYWYGYLTDLIRDNKNSVKK